MSRSTNRSSTAKQNHLVTGGELLLKTTEERIQRTSKRVMRSKRIDEAFDVSKNLALNWRAPSK